MTTDKRFTCRFCGTHLNAWLPVPKQLDGATLLRHPSQSHPSEVGPYLEHRRTEDIAAVAAQAFTVVERGNDGI
jgi:hypothetical protein